MKARRDRAPHDANEPSPDRADALARLRKIEGQVRGIQRMLEEDAYCIDTLNQISAVIAATEKVAIKVLEEHISHCVAGALGSEDGQAKIDELTKALQTFLKIGNSAVSAGR